MTIHEAATKMIDALGNGTYTQTFIAEKIAQSRTAIAQGKGPKGLSATEYLAVLDIVEAKLLNTPRY